MIVESVLYHTMVFYFDYFNFHWRNPSASKFHDGPDRVTCSS